MVIAWRNARLHGSASSVLASMQGLPPQPAPTGVCTNTSSIAGDFSRLTDDASLLAATVLKTPAFTLPVGSPITEEYTVNSVDGPIVDDHFVGTNPSTVPEPGCLSVIVSLIVLGALAARRRSRMLSPSME